MQKLFIIFFILATTTHISFAAPAKLDGQCIQKSDKEYRELILGTWNGEEEMRFSKEIVYLPKQTFLKNGDLIINFVDKSYPEQILVTVKGKWRIKDGQLYEQAVSYSAPEFNAGYGTTVDKIQCLHRHLLELLNERGILERYTK